MKLVNGSWLFDDDNQSYFDFGTSNFNEIIPIKPFMLQTDRANNSYAIANNLSSSEAASVSAGNIWVSEGPGPGINGQETVAPNNQIGGAIQAIATDPTNPNVMYVGSVNGGIWKTSNATSNSPHWTPLTDNLPSLSIGALEFDPTDNTHKTLIAGIGAESSYRIHDTGFRGVLRTTDGGLTWSQLGNSSSYLAGEDITSVAARGATLLAAADNTWSVADPGLGKGLFRSTDAGTTWSLISDGAHGLPSLTPVSDLVGDPLNSNVFYAGVTGANGGIYKSNDTGLNWVKISNGINTIGSTTDKIEIAVHSDSVNTSIYATVDNGGVLSGVFRSSNGSSFVALDVPTGGVQGDVHGAIAADPNNASLVYVGLGGGSSHYLTRIDASRPSGSQITDLSGGTFGSPHVDTREMQFDAAGNLVLGTDGGLFKLPSPATNSGAWTAIVGDMSAFEIHSIAYDHISHIVMAGTQDNGTLFQSSTGSATWDHPGFGDGGDVAIDNVSLASSGESIRYFSSQNLSGWTRQVYDSNNHLVSTTNLSTTTPDTAGGDDDDDLGDSPITDPSFTTPIAINNVDPSRILVGGTAHIYQSLNQGTTLTSISNTGVNGIGYNGGNEMIYGGFKGGVSNSDLIYAASGANILKQTVLGGSITTLSPGGSTIRGVSDNPNDWSSVFAIDQNHVFHSNDAGATWSDITANLGSISSLDLRSIEYVHGRLSDAVVVGTSSGVFYANLSGLNSASPWSKAGSNMPDVIVYDLKYDATDNVLVAGTFGRGAWLVKNATAVLGLDQQDQPGTLTLSGLDASQNAHEGTPIVATILDPDGNPNSANYSFIDVAHGNRVLYQGPSNTYNPGFREAGEVITVTATYTDGLGNSSSISSSAGTVQNVTSLSYNFNFSQSTVSFDHNKALLRGPDGVIHDVTGVEQLQFTDGTINEHNGSPVVDDLFYFAHNLDVWNAHVDATTHYNQSGWREGRDPSVGFSTKGYLAANADVAAAGINPLYHYDMIGWKEGRDPSAAFDNELYLLNNPDVKAAGVDPLAHFLTNGQAEGRVAYTAIGPSSSFNHGSFDAEYYVLSNPDVAAALLASGTTDSYGFAFQHYVNSGAKEGRAPDAYFDPAYYLAHNPDVASAGVNPLQHYDQFGWKEGRDPSGAFHTNAYLAANTDVAAAHIDPLTHYLQYGADEGRHLA